MKMFLESLSRHRAVIGIALAVAAVLANAVMSVSSLQRVASIEQDLNHSHEIVNSLQESLSLLKDAETGYRGYHITGADEYLEPYRAAVSGMPKCLQNLRRLLADSPDQASNMETLSAHVQLVLDHLEEGIGIRRDQGLEPSRSFIKTGQGKREMDRARQIVAQMEQIEDRDIQKRAAKAHASYRTALASTFIVAGLALGMVALASWLAVRELRATKQLAAIVAGEHAELDRRVRERTRELSQANLALAQSNRELEQFAAVASHDLQEPLRKIQAFGDRLKSKCNDQLGEQGRDYVDRMHAAATRMRALIDALLTFSRISTRAQVFVPCNLDQIARDVVTDLEGRLEESGGRVELGPLPVITGDALQMRQLLQNLIGNALKFRRPETPPLVQVSCRRWVEAPARGEGRGERRCEITVADNGIGFDETFLDRIFDVFQRLQGREVYEGTGMGLAICRKIVERHGGLITARSAVGQGSRFIVTLPEEQTGPVA